MKKMIVLLLCLFALAACTSSETVKIENGSDAIITSEKETYTRQDLFDDLRNTDYTSVILDDLMNKIAALEEVDFTSLEKEIDTEIAELKAIYGESYLYLVDYYGGEESIRQTILTSLANQALADKYYEIHLEELTSEYKPIKAQLAYFSSLEDANSFIEKVSTTSTFDSAAIEFGYTTSTLAKVYTDKDSLAFEVKEYLNSNPSLGLSNVIETITTTTDADGNTVENPRYYVLNIVDLDVNNFKDEFISALSYYVNQDDIYNYYFAKYDIEFFDQTTYELMKEAYPGLE